MRTASSVAIIRPAMRLCSPLLVLLALGCGPDAATVPPSEPQAPVAAPIHEAEPPAQEEKLTVLQQLEASLLQGDHRLRFEITSEGALTSKLVGTLVMVDQRIELEAAGTFGDTTPLTLALTADGTTLSGTGRGNRFEVPQPPHLREAIVLGLVRMGLLHNLAVLVSGRPPDHAEAGVGDWLRTTPLEPGSFAPPSETRGRQTAYGFELFVAGDRAASVSVWVDDGLLVERRQVVNVGEAKMHVTEKFSRL